MIAERIEFQERELSDTQLLNKWPQEFDALNTRLQLVSAVSELVDVLRSANLRRGESWRRVHLNEIQFKVWEEKWHQLKYQTLFKALEWRKAGNPNILVGYFLSRRRQDVQHGMDEKITFKFILGGKSYRTETSINNLIRTLPADQLIQLIGAFDPISRPHHKPPYFNDLT